MRLHRLTLRAFGPFPGEHVVDVDALAAAGVFLLHGPTGAGKTSVLDAICFALYGRVPGARAGRSRLRSDHAPAGVGPVVTCEATFGGSRWQITRSPQWERAKKRGSGTTTEQAKVVVRRWDGEGWVAVTNRLDEAGQLLDEALGLGLDQFTTIALLPQGDFASFLHADAEARRAVLERLFDTRRFAALADLLRAERARTGAAVGRAAHEAALLLARAQEVARTLPALARALPDVARPGPEPCDGSAGPAGALPTAPPGPEEVIQEAVAVATRMRGIAAATAAEAAATREIACRAQTAAQARARAAEDLADRQAEAARLRVRLAALTADRPARQRRRERLDAAERSARIAPALDAHRVAEESLACARRRRDDLAAGLGIAPDDADPASRLRVAQEGLTLLRALVSELEEWGDVPAQAARCLTDASAARARSAELLAEAAGVRAALDDLRDAANPAGDLPSREVADARVAALQSAAAAVPRLDAATRRLTALRERHLGARDAAAAARRHWLDLREQRLGQAAADLAARLSAGQPCPVCGSDVHPAPAQEAGRLVTEAAEAQALAVADAARAEEERIGVEVAAAREEAATARARLGENDAGALPELLANARAVAAAAAEAEADRTRRARQAVTLERRLRALDDRAAAATREAAAAAATAAAAQERLQLYRRRCGRAGVGDAEDAARRLEHLEREVVALRQLLEAGDAVRLAQAGAETSAAAAIAAARHAGFADPREALAARIEESDAVRERGALEREERDHDEVVASLATPRLAGAESREPADVVAALAALELAREEADRRLLEESAATVAADALAAIEDAARRLHAEAAPVLAQHAVADALARCAEGTGGDNQLRLPLPSYVLQARLEQVAAAATARLARMSDGRFGLVLPEAGSRPGRGRAGLTLQVLDSWTGRQRDTATLSGGETFYTSLALALGLADVVSAEAGGAGVETLFVDEGFGSLDEDTLDDVMDVLDDLRSGGRAVGLVSHVRELHQRIPARLEVVKHRAGSSLRQPASPA